MFWQWLVVALICGLAGAYLVRATWKTWFGSKRSCGGGCHCAVSQPAHAAQPNGTTLIPVEQLRLRQRPDAAPR